MVPQGAATNNNSMAFMDVYTWSSAAAAQLYEDLHDPFNLDKKLLKEYPELTFLSGKTMVTVSQDARDILRIYENGNSIDKGIKAVINNKFASSIDSYIELVNNWLEELKAKNNSVYEKFIELESLKLQSRSRLASKTIGSKERNHKGFYVIPTSFN
jgi:hypothetical protein